MARDLGFSETVFVDDAAEGAIRIFTPGSELPVRRPPDRRDRLAVPGDRRPGRRSSARRPATSRSATTPSGRGSGPDRSGSIRSAVEQLASAAEVEGQRGQAMGEPGRYVWAWIDEPAGIAPIALLRDRRRDPRGRGDRRGGRRDGRTASAGRSRSARASGSEILVRPRDDGTVEIGGRVELVETREYDLGQ